MNIMRARKNVKIRSKPFVIKHRELRGCPTAS